MSQNNQEKKSSAKAGRAQERDYHVGICPYYMRDRGQGVVYCECAKFRFPDKVARREILYSYCAHPDGYKQCVLKQMMDRYYERKYESIKNQESEGQEYA